MKDTGPSIFGDDSGTAPMESGPSVVLYLLTRVRDVLDPVLCRVPAGGTPWSEDEEPANGMVRTPVGGEVASVNTVGDWLAAPVKVRLPGGGDWAVSWAPRPAEKKID